MKRTVLMLSLAASLLGIAPVAHADLNSFLQSVNKQALSDIRNFNDMLSRQFGIPVPDVDAIVRRVPDPADAFMILQLGEMAHVAPALVLQKYERSKGKGWGNLARELGIKPGSREFHALKRGDLSFTGERGGMAMERKGGGQGSGREHGNSKGKGRDKD
ncbi:MAG: hypothetical protein HY799_10895 [Nitrosomonadales bacterium]|nr:hypothetical protein [Nitrosomonadales bacterium]